MKPLLIHGDCLTIMSDLPKVDMILVDPPYGTTQCKWDSVIHLDDMWRLMPRKGNTPVVMTAQTPYDKVLGCSNLKELRYEWIWEKTAATGHLNSKKMPLKSHENILVFYGSLPTYNPQKTTGHKPVNSYTKHGGDGDCYGTTQVGISGGGSTERYPRSVQKFSSDKQKSNLHPTQKPLALMEYLVKTYSNEGDTILDFAMGSGTTGVACVRNNRRFIGIEVDSEYFKISENRIMMEYLLA